MGSLYHISVNNIMPYSIKVKVCNVPIDMKIDTGSGVLISPYKLYTEKFKNVQLCDSNILMKSLFLVMNNGPALLGRNWLETLKLDWSTVSKIISSDIDLFSFPESHSQAEILGELELQKGFLRSP